MNLNAIIVDDEFHARENLQTQLKMVNAEVNILATSAGGTDAIEKIKQLKPDLLFLDIEMPVFNGFELLKAFPNPEFSLIVVTAYSKYGMDAVNASAQYFLQKPIDSKLLTEAILKVRKQRTLFSESLNEILTNQQSIQNMVKQVVENKAYTEEQTLEYDGRKVIIKTEDIVYLEADSNYTYFHLIDERRLVDFGHLGHFEKFFDPSLFVRIHRSYLSNLVHIKEIHRSKMEVEFKNGRSIPVSRRKLTEVKAKYNEFQRAQ